MSNPICISRSCQNATENSFASFLVLASQCQALSAFVESSKLHLRSVLPLAHLSAFSAARETQIDLAFYFLTEVGQNVSPSAFPESFKMHVKNCFAPFLVIAGQCHILSAFVVSAKMHLSSALPLALLSAFSAAQETQIEFAFFFVSHKLADVKPHLHFQKLPKCN